MSPSELEMFENASGWRPWLEGRIRETITGAGTTIFRIPEQHQSGVLVRVIVPTAGTYMVSSILSPKSGFPDDDYSEIAEFTANQTTSKDLSFDPGLSAISIEVFSGEIIVEVVAK